MDKVELSAYLDAINWAFWQTPEDTPCLITELMHAVSEAALPIATSQAKSGLLQSSATLSLPPPSASALLEMPEGTMDPQSTFYPTFKGSECTSRFFVLRAPHTMSG